MTSTRSPKRSWGSDRGGLPYVFCPEKKTKMKRRRASGGGGEGFDCGVLRDAGATAAWLHEGGSGTDVVAAT